MPDRRSWRRSYPVVAMVAVVAVLEIGDGPAAAGAAWAQSVSGEELEALAEKARQDPVALRRLRAVETVDGRPVDLGRALGGADGEVLDARLRALAGGGAGGGSAAESAASARADARRILAQRRFRATSTPRPLRGLLRRLGTWLRPVLQPIGRLWGDVAGNVAGRLLVVVAVIGLAALTALRLIRRRTAAGVAPGARVRTIPGQDPEALERDADQAERDGYLDLAFRLRFRAGLLRLARAGLVPASPSLTTGQLSRSLCSPSFDELAVTFDEIAYGGRNGTAADLQAARTGWPAVLREARAPERDTASTGAAA